MLKKLVLREHVFFGVTVNSPLKPARPPYQLAPLPTPPTNSPHLFYQLAPLLLPARPILFVNSPQLSDTTRPNFYQLAPPLLLNSPFFSYQLASLLLPTRLTFLTTRPTFRTR